jgi:hypothetical protein
MRESEMTEVYVSPYWREILDEIKKNMEKTEQKLCDDYTHSIGPCGLSDERVKELTKAHEVQNDRYPPISSSTCKPRS